MKLLITGGTGMLGQALVRRYHRSFSIRFTGRNSVIGTALANATGAEFYPAELLNQQQLEAACRGMDAVIHCAALSSPWGTPTAFYNTNVLGTEYLLLAALVAGVKRFVHISTPSLYFQFQHANHITETHPLGSFCNQYAKTKAQAERRVLASPLHSVILRPRGIFGPHDHAIVPRLIAATRHQTLWLPSGRNPSVDLTYVDNVADAAILALTQPVDRGNIFNITNDQPVHLLDTLRTLFSQLQPSVTIKTLPYAVMAPLIAALEWRNRQRPGYPEPTLTRYSAGLFHYDQTLDITKAKSILGYCPAVSIKEGIQRYVSWYQNQSL